MKKYSFNIFIFLLMTGSILPLSAQEETKVITKDTLGNKFTLAVFDHTQERTQPVTVKICFRYGSQARQATILLSEDAASYVYDNDTIMLMRNSMPNYCRTTTWTLVRNSSLRLYQEGVLLGTVKEETLKEDVHYGFYITGSPDRVSKFDGSIISLDDAITPKEEIPGGDKGTALINHSDKLKNLAPDPCCNYGLISSLPSVYTTANAAFRAASSVISTTEAFSGHSAILCEDGAEDGEIVLSQNITFASGTPYLIRFMARSDGYRARLFIEGENNWLDIPDTDDKWTLMECVFTPVSSRTKLSLKHISSETGASLILDDWEVYAALSATSKVGANTYVSGVQLSTGQKWVPTHEVEAHWVGFRNSSTQCATIDTALVKVTGLTSLTLPVKGSALYALAFPGALNGMHVTGTYDMASHNNEQLINGIDYLLQRYDYPRFEFIEPTKEDSSPARISAGCYIVQFVDNLEGTNVTLNFASINKEAFTMLDTSSDYSFVGNPVFNKYTPDGKFLRFNPQKNQFELTRDEELNPFEAYIATTSSAPVATISTGYDTRIKQLQTPDGGRLGISLSRGSVTLRATTDTNIQIINLTGQQICHLILQPGIPTTVSLPTGFYLIGQSKVFIQ